MKNFILIYFMVFISSCSLAIDNPKQDVNYKLTMKIDNMGLVYEGLALFAVKPLYTIEFTSKGLMDWFSFNSCSTSITKQNAGGRIFKRKSTKVNYRPNEIEQNEICDIKIDSTEKHKQRNTSGYIVFKNPMFTMPGTVICGERVYKYNGVSICQNFVGNKFKVKFDSMVYASTDCGEIKNGTEFTVTTKPGFCNYVFRNRKTKENHRLVVHGWTEEMLN